MRAFETGADCTCSTADGAGSPATDDTDGATNAGHNLLTDTVQETADEFTNNNLFALEEDTFGTLAEATSIRKVKVTDGGNGYSKLPTVSVTSTSGTSASLKSNTTDIGRANGIQIKDGSFDLDSNNPPDATFQAHFVLKDVTGTFASGNTLTSHTGTVSGWNADTQVLSTTFENVVRTKGQPSSAVNEGIRLEDNSESEPHGILLEDEKDFEIVRKELSCYLLANMTEFSKSKLFNYKELENFGYNIVIYPVTTQRLAMKNVEDGLRDIYANGHQNNIIDKMQTRKRLYELVDYEKYNSLDEKIYNFSTEGHE